MPETPPARITAKYGTIVKVGDGQFEHVPAATSYVHADLVQSLVGVLRKWESFAEMNRRTFTSSKGEPVPLVTETRAALAAFDAATPPEPSHD